MINFEIYFIFLKKKKLVKGVGNEIIYLVYVLNLMIVFLWKFRSIKIICNYCLAKEVVQNLRYEYHTMLYIFRILQYWQNKGYTDLIKKVLGRFKQIFRKIMVKKLVILGCKWRVATLNQLRKTQLRYTLKN